MRGFPSKLRPFPSAFTLVIAALLVGGCADFFGGETGSPGGPQPGPGSSGDWYLQPLEGPVAPLENVQLIVKDMDVDPEEVLLRVDGANPFPLEDAYQSEDESKKDFWAFETRLPIIEPGTHKLSLGTSKEAKSNAIDVEVVVPKPRLSKAEAAKKLGDGVRAVTSEVETLVFHDNPQWRTWMQQAYTDEERKNFRGFFDKLHESADKIQDDYMSMSSEEERIAQSVLHNSGMFEFLDGIREGNPKWGSRSGALSLPFDELIKRPVHRILYKLDFVSGMLNAAGTIADVITLVGFIAGGPAASIPYAAAVVMAVIKAFIDILIPTDLVFVREQDQENPFAHDHPVPWIYWGKFEPESPPEGGLIGTAQSLLVATIGEALPGGKQYARLPGGQATKEEILQFFHDFFRNNVAAYGLDKVFSIKDSGERVWTIKTILDMRVYSVTFAEIVSISPFVGETVKWILGAADFEIIDAISVEETSDSWAGSAEAHYDYENDRIWVDGIDYPTGSKHTKAKVTLKGTAYRYKPQKFLGIWPVPGFGYKPRVHGQDRIYDRPDPDDPNAARTNTDYIITHINTPEGPIEYWIGRDTTEKRNYELVFEDLFDEGNRDGAKVTVTVNGERVAEDVDATGRATVPIEFTPNKNRVVIELEHPHLIPCSGGTKFCVEVTVPDAMNRHNSRVIRSNRESFLVWTPPTVDD